jgi:hypothetical protein
LHKASLDPRSHIDLIHHWRPENRWRADGQGQLKWYGWGKTDGQSAWSVSLSDKGAWNGQCKPVPLMLLSDALAMPIPDPWQGAVGLQADLSLGYQPPPQQDAEQAAPPLPSSLSITLTLPTQTLDWPGVFPQPVHAACGRRQPGVAADRVRPEASAIRLLPSSLHLGNGRFDLRVKRWLPRGRGLVVVVEGMLSSPCQNPLRSA